MKITRNPTLRVRQAVRGAKGRRKDDRPKLMCLLTQITTLLCSPITAQTDLRNTDRNRLTSLSWAAIEGSLEVFEWLLLDYGHDDQELSRVGLLLLADV